MIYTLLGIFGGGFVICGYIALELSKKLSVLKNNEKTLEQNLANYNGQEQFFEREIKILNEKYQQILFEKDRNIAEIKQQSASQMREIKQDYEQRLARKKEDDDKIRESFSNIANAVLEQKNRSLQEQSMKSIQHVLEPFKVDITNFKQLIHTVENQRVQQHASLETQMKSMQNVNQSMIQTAENLTKALKGDSKVQGNWGEMVVKKLLESAGLIEGEHYIEQGTGLNLKDDESRLQQPDFIINLPNNKHIILDSKVSLTHYERFCSTENEDEIKGFLTSINKHISELSAKKYHANPKLNAPDFTMMFIPIESAYFLAVHKDSQLYQKAWEKRIALVCPSTLLAMLQTIGNLWEIDMQNKNTQKIVERAKLMYEKFKGFIGSLDSVGKNLDSATKSFETAKKQLTEGRGNLDSQFREMISYAKLDAKLGNQPQENVDSTSVSLIEE